ncbi:class II glutamine amidotransferase [Exilibacterium tricleocarpae]|uniref:Class II glutamine amidotransferase n=1 Tax=Exilibacterium tricleocarpae TaxID=2591008 RepID=A0A545U5S0_9GAMM|nr:class II glutamine amidotransferase [Exilibacterium tricleocarpae]TQV84812.1 class II glutamine amidotransferase [Exilibacterium tricleocarpae]
MCELLGMSANVPTDICFSWAGMMNRGGATGPHKDGWGIAFYEGRGIREFRDPAPSYTSEIARFVRNYPIKSETVISHIRQANVGNICLENTHPFIRELHGSYWCYAHNGQLQNFTELPLGQFRPVGTTDSEHAFCWLLQQIAGEVPTTASSAELGAVLHRCCRTLSDYGVFNMLLSNAQTLFVYCSTKLHWITRRAPFGKAQLQDNELTVNFAEHTTPTDVVSVIATEPLTTNETWTALAPGELIAFAAGEVVGRWPATRD